MSRLVDTDRAIADLRRGLPVVIFSDGEKNALVAVAAEFASEPNLSYLQSWDSNPPALVLTKNRASVLHIMPSDGDVVVLPLTERLDPPTIRSLADPTADMDNPMRGPFQRLKTRASPLNDAAIKLCKLARLLPAALVVENISDGTATAIEIARARNLIAVEADDIFSYDTRDATELTQLASARIPLEGAEKARMVSFRPRDGGTEHFAIIIGDPSPSKPVLIRIHSECFTGDLIGSLRCDCGQQLRGSIDQINEAGGGMVLYLSQEGRGIGLINKLRAYQLQDQGFDTIDANERLGFEADERMFLPAAEMLKRLGFSQVLLMTNNPEKVAGLEAFGITVVERVPHAFPSNSHNESYLSTKSKRSGHYL